MSLASLDGPFLQDATPNAQIGLQRDGDGFRHRVVGWPHGAVLDAGIEFEDGLFASEYAYLDGKRVSLTVDRINAEFRREIERPHFEASPQPSLGPLPTDEHGGGILGSIEQQTPGAASVLFTTAAAAVPEGPAATPPVRPATAQPVGGKGVVLRDAQGATAAEIAASKGGPTGGSRVGQAAVRKELLKQAEASGQPYRCVRQTINLVAGTGPKGGPVYEEVLVEPLEGQRFKLLSSPGLVLGAAAGDTIDVDANGHFIVVERGGNVCVQIFRPSADQDLEAFAVDTLGRLNGILDGNTEKQLVFSVPVSVGFTALEDSLNELIRKYPDAEWYYGNVYDPADGETPLDWWK